MPNWLSGENVPPCIPARTGLMWSGRGAERARMRAEWPPAAAGGLWRHAAGPFWSQSDVSGGDKSISAFLQVGLGPHGRALPLS